MAGFYVVVPVHDGEEHIPPLTAALAGVELPGCHLILVDDRSRDGSWEKIRGACAAPPPGVAITGVRLKTNRGQQSALLAGLTLCRDRNAAGVITMDDDLSHPVSLIPELLEALTKGADLVYADPPARPGSPLRRLASRLHQRHLSLLTGSPPELKVGSFRGMSISLVRDILEAPFGWPYLSAMALSRRPKPVGTMVSSPGWTPGHSGRFSISRLMMLEVRLFLHYGPWSRRPHPSGTSAAAGTGSVAAGWIAETAGEYR